MLFRKRVPRSCYYCSHAAVLDDGQLLCAKKGILEEEKPCIKFSYDACKRIPPKQTAPNFSKYEETDFKL